MNTYMNSDWLFVEGFKDGYISKPPKGAEEIDIPHPARYLPYHCFTSDAYQGIFTYFKRFDAPNSLPVQILVFEGAMLQFDCYLNGIHLGHFISGYLPVKIDISKAIKKKGNQLVVKLDSHEDPAIPPFGNVVDYMTFAGIYRKVRIESHPAHYMKDVFFDAKGDGSYKAHLDTLGDEPSFIKVYDGKKLLHSSTELEGKIKGIEPWSPDHPKLYTVQIHYGDDTLELKVGFRTVKVQENGLYINGERIKLRGLNRHQTYPYIGGAAPDAMQIDDARILKNELGCNVVRTSHYPQDESFLDECDRLGLLVIDEIPGWQFVSKDEKWRENCLDFAKRMILKERNHPSLILYGLRVDESVDDHELYSQIQAIKKELDPDRPSIGVRYFKGSELLEDVFGYNDFNGRDDLGLDSSKSYRKERGKPKLVTEHNGHMFPTKSCDTTERRADQAFRHAKVMNDAYKDENLLGAIGWCAFDYNTHKTFGNMDHICYHGVCDIFRNKKYAAYAYASQGETNSLMMASTLQTSDYNAALLPITYVYTDCDQVEAFVNGKRIGFLQQDKKDFPHLPHPPFILDDIVGERIDEKFSEKDKKRVAKAFSYIAHYGMNKIHLSHGLLLLKIMLKYHYSYPDLYQMYGKYVVGWGSDGVVYEFIGYKDGKEVVRQKRGPSSKYQLRVTTTKTELTYGDIYDVSRVTIECVDEFGTRIYMADDLLKLEADENLRILGPSEVHLVGGAISVYVAGKKVEKACKSRLIIQGSQEAIPVDFIVK